MTTGQVSNAHDCSYLNMGINTLSAGSIAILELAVQLSKYRLKNAVRFAWWTAEEFGLVGSEHYVANLPEEDRKKIALYINLDMVASPNYVHAVYVQSFPVSPHY